MKIAIIGPVYPYRGGIAHYVTLLYHSLVERGHDVKVITFSRQYPKLLFPGKTQNEIDQTGIFVDSIRVIDSINPLTWYKAAKLAADFEPDTLIFNYWHPLFALCYGVISRAYNKLMRGKGKKGNSILIAHNVLPHERLPLDTELTKYAFKKIDNFIVQSITAENDMKLVKPDAPYLRLEHPVYEMFGKPIPKTEARKRLGIRDDAPVLLFFGFIRKYKGIDILLRAMPNLIKKYPTLVLIVAGESYGGEDDVQVLVNELGIPPENLRLFIEYIPNSDVPLYFSAVNVVVLPYRTATQSGIVQIAYNFEVPAIVTDVGGLSEIVVDGVSGLIAKEVTSESVELSVKKFFDDGLEEQLRNGVRVEKKKYSWDMIVNGIEGIVNG